MPYKQLSKSNKEMFLMEIEEWKSAILQKKHELVKMSFNRENIQESLQFSIDNERNKILSAKEMITDHEYNLKNKVSFTELGVLITKAEQEIKRHTKNIQARELQIRQGVLENPTRDEKAREELKKKMEAKEDGQPEEEEDGRQENVNAEA